MTDTINIRRPRPGDVWERSGKKFFIRSYNVKDMRCFIDLEDGSLSNFAPETIFMNPENWRYLGQASDLIDEDLNNQKKGHPNAFQREITELIEIYTKQRKAYKPGTPMDKFFEGMCDGLTIALQSFEKPICMLTETAGE